MKYQQPANRGTSPQSNQLPHLQPRIHRSQSANDAAVSGSYLYGGYDAYSGYDGAYGYHRHAAEQAPDDASAAYHQYHAQAAMQHAQRMQHTLAPIYDNVTYDPQSAVTDPHTYYNLHSHYKQTKKRTETNKNETEDGLPLAPTQLRHASTMPYHHIDLRYELEQKQNEKQLKHIELEHKRKELTDKKSLNLIGQKDIEETKKEWNLEREEIIKSFGGKIPSFIIESDKLRKDLENMTTRNSALQASLEVISSQLQSELCQLQCKLKFENEISEQTQNHNIELERRVRELKIEELELETELKAEKDKTFDINIITTKTEEKGEEEEGTFREYPPESTVIQNLLQSQVEFYLSDYNLKRDKRLLTDVVKEPKKGFLRLEEVMKLSRIRQLCNEIETLEEALRRSTILTLIREKKEDLYTIWVGRLNFEKPREKEFPFRRTVFIFGIPVNESSDFLHSMLKPFGTLSKIQFDHSPDGIDRKIGIRFLNKPRVYVLYYNDSNREEMIFKTSYDNNSNIKCHKCCKDKAVSEGFYTTNEWKVIYCSQCAAQLAEDQLNVYYKERNIPQYQHNPRHKWLGIAPNDIQKRKTALVVFASQRQASKCAYVRSRIACKGAFATHFHHYSKVKKEIVLSESDENEINNNNTDTNKKKEENKNNNKQKRKGRGRGRGKRNCVYYHRPQPPQIQKRTSAPPY